MKKVFFLFVLFHASLNSIAQSSKINSEYEITVNLKNYKDTVGYLYYYQFGNKITAATCHSIKNDKIIFKGKGKLKKGIYSLNGSDKKSYLDFFIDESTQKLELKSEDTENYLRGVVALNSKLENDFFTYIKYSIKQNTALKEIIASAKGLSKKDSIAMVTPKVKAILKDIYDYEDNFITQNKGTYIADVINLKIERSLREVPTASNGRPDSLLVNKYFRKHYWDNVNFNDEAICRNQFFGAKVNRYFDNIIPTKVDSVTVEIDKLINKTKVNPILTKLLLDHLVNKYEMAAMGFDIVLIHLVDTYFINGKAKAFYKDQSEIDRIIRRADKIRPLQVGKVAPDLAMIRATDRDKIANMGFENVKTNDELTKLFFSKEKEINDLYLKMNSVKAKYLIVAFWDVDCSHCKIEIPKLLNLYHEFQKENKDVKVFSVYVYHEVGKYIKYIDENKLDWINVYDGVFYNNVVDKYEVRTTPVIYILDENKVIKTKKIEVDKIKSTIESWGYK
jgi:thiol-disulfide isomerase/thioredoxin